MGTEGHRESNLPGGIRENTHNCFSVNPTQLGFLLVLDQIGKTGIHTQEVWIENLPNQCALGFPHLLGLTSGTELSLPFLSFESYALRGSMEVHAALNRESVVVFFLKTKPWKTCSVSMNKSSTIIVYHNQRPFSPTVSLLKKLLNSTHEPCWTFPWTPLIQALCYLYSLKLIKVFFIFITSLTFIAEAYSAISRIPGLLWKFSKWKPKNTNESWQPEVPNLVCGFSEMRGVVF